MSRLTTCSACQLGDHERHREIVQAAPEGGVGGAVCTCKGECAERDKAELAEEFLKRCGLGFLSGRKQPRASWLLTVTHQGTGSGVLGGLLVAKTAPQPDVPPVAGERTWTIWRCPTCEQIMEAENREQMWCDQSSQGGKAWLDTEPQGRHPVVEMEFFEVVELSRLRAAEEERDELRSERSYLAKQMSWEAGQTDPVTGIELTPGDVALEALFEQDRQAEKAEAERDRLAEVLKGLDSALEARFPSGGANPPGLTIFTAWSLAREALASLEGGDE